MKYILGLPTDQVQLIEEFGTAEAISEIASKAETLGYHGVFVTDHPIPPASVSYTHLTLPTIYSV